MITVNVQYWQVLEQIEQGSGGAFIAAYLQVR